MVLHSQRDEPNTQREYETIYIVRPDAEADALREVNARARRVIEEASGKLLRVENWGKRKLAYEIAKHNKGVYLYWRYLGPPQLVAELERNLRMLDSVLRYLTVKVDENVNVNARPTDVTEDSFNAAADTAPDEEDMFLRMGRGERDWSDDDDSDDDFDDSDDDDDTRRPSRAREASDESAVDGDESEEAGDDE